MVYRPRLSTVANIFAFLAMILAVPTFVSSFTALANAAPITANDPSSTARLTGGIIAFQQESNKCNGEEPILTLDIASEAVPGTIIVKVQRKSDSEARTHDNVYFEQAVELTGKDTRVSVPIPLSNNDNELRIDADSKDTGPNTHGSRHAEVPTVMVTNASCASQSQSWQTPAQTAAPAVQSQKAQETDPLWKWLIDHLIWFGAGTIALCVIAVLYKEGRN